MSLYKKDVFNKSLQSALDSFIPTCIILIQFNKVSKIVFYL